MTGTEQGVTASEKERILEGSCASYQTKQTTNESKLREEGLTMTKSQMSSPEAESSQHGSPAILPQVFLRFFSSFFAILAHYHPIISSALSYAHCVGNGDCLQVLGTGVAAMAQMDIGGIFAYPGVTLPQLLDGTSADLVFTTAQAALFGRSSREL